MQRLDIGKKQNIHEGIPAIHSRVPMCIDTFSDVEQTILELTVQMTLIHQLGLTEIVYSKAVALFGEETTGQMMMSIFAVNSWNRSGIGLH